MKVEKMKRKKRKQLARNFKKLLDLEKVPSAKISVLDDLNKQMAALSDWHQYHYGAL